MEDKIERTKKIGSQLIAICETVPLELGGRLKRPAGNRAALIGGFAADKKEVA